MGPGFDGRDPKTGKVVRTLTQEMTGPMAHDRCYRNRITHRYYLNSATGGTDFLALDGSLESPNPWARSTCGLAVMPANGMIYNGPYVCQCAIGTMASGVNGFYNGSGNTGKQFTVEPAPRLVKGPAFGSTSGVPATASDWPTYRYSSMRSAVAAATTAESLSPKWKVDIGSQPTAPIVAGDTVYVADRDSYILHALDRETGKTRWTYIADGCIDSPPTYYKGMVLFGTRYGLGPLPACLGWPTGMEILCHARAAFDLRHGSARIGLAGERQRHDLPGYGLLRGRTQLVPRRRYRCLRARSSHRDDEARTHGSGTL